MTGGMNGERDPKAPRLDTLKNLSDAMPGFVKAMAQGKLKGGGIPVPSNKPRKTCPVCCTFYDFITCLGHVPVEQKYCKDCQAMLQQGYVALIAGDRYAFVKCDALKDWAGTTKRVSPGVFLQIKHKFDLICKERNGD